MIDGMEVGRIIRHLIGKSPDHFHRPRFSRKKIYGMVLFDVILNTQKGLLMYEPFRFGGMTGGYKSLM